MFLNIFSFSPTLTSSGAAQLNIILKIIAFLLMFFLEVRIASVYKKKKSSISFRLAMTFFFFALSPLFSLFNDILGWRDIYRTGSSLGGNIALMMNGFANAFYYSFIGEVVRKRDIPAKRVVHYAIIFGLTETISTGIIIYSKLIGLDFYLIFGLIHLALSAYVYIYISWFSKNMMRRIQDSPHSERFIWIYRSGLAGLTTIIIFIFDNFFEGVTIFGLIGWIFFMITGTFLYLGYLRQVKE